MQVLVWRVQVLLGGIPPSPVNAPPVVLERALSTGSYYLGTWLANAQVRRGPPFPALCHRESRRLI